jgi:hypothetical protein
MTPIEKLKALVEDDADWCRECGLSEHAQKLVRLLPELIALWEAVEKWDSIYSTGFDVTLLSARLDALNAKAQEVLQ